MWSVIHSRKWLHIKNDRKRGIKKGQKKQSSTVQAGHLYYVSTLEKKGKQLGASESMMSTV